MTSLVQFIKQWMLPIAIVAGISIYTVFHFVPALHPIGPVCHQIVAKGQRFLISVMLFLQFVKVSPRDLKFHRWHLYAIIFQLVTSFAAAIGAAFAPEGAASILLECAMICLVCPTAAAAGVITDRLGGSLSENITYVVLINAVATLVIPVMIPLIHPSADTGFFRCMLGIAMKIFPILLLPSILAWIIRYTMPTLQEWLSKRAHWAFYFWGIGLTFAMILATRALILSNLGIVTMLCIIPVSILSCAIGFFTGRHLSRQRATSITAGQALGQKNPGFLIWLGYTYLTPVTSVAGGLYAIWQNIFNSWELWAMRRRQGR
jgi:BASS family bile acid:Na+ symporter